MDWNAILTPALGAIAIAIAGLLVAVFNGLVSKYKAKIEAEISKIKDEQKRALAWDAMERVIDLVDATVNELEQTTVAGIREAIADKKVDKNELHKLSKVALDKVYSQLKLDTKELLGEQFEDVQGYILSKIESAVLGLKK
jgi:hypothetical protein